MTETLIGETVRVGVRSGEDVNAFSSVDLAGAGDRVASMTATGERQATTTKARDKIARITGSCKTSRPDVKYTSG